MIARVIRGRGFGGTVRYCQQKAVGQRPLASSLLSEDPNGPTQEEVIYHFRSLTSTREAARPVVHIPIRIRDGERLSEEQWLLAVERVRLEMGFENCPWAAYIHDNEGGREGQHVHLVLSRVTLDGKIVSDKNDRFRVTDVMRTLEHDLGLEAVQSNERSAPRLYPHGPDGRERGREFIMLRAQIDAAGGNARTLKGFVERLEAAGVRVHLKVSRNGHLQGASFQLEGSHRIWKGSDLGRAYSIGRLVERFELAQEGDVLRALEVRPRELAQLRSAGLAPDRVEGSGGGRMTASWALVGTPREQDVYQQLVQAALPGRLCERSSSAAEWQREVAPSVLEVRRQQVDVVLSARGTSVPPLPLLAEGPQGVLEAGRQVEALLEKYASERWAGESAERLSATWLEILRWTGVRGVRPDALERRGLAQQLAGLGSLAETPAAIRSRLLRGERGYVSAPVVAGELTYFPPHLLETNRGSEHREFNRQANQILGERESVALLRVADRLGNTREDRRLRDRVERRLAEVERANVGWGGRRSGGRVIPIERTKNAEAARRYVSRRLACSLRRVEKGLTRGLVQTAAAFLPRPRLPGLGLLAKANAAAGVAQDLGYAVLAIEAAVRRELHGAARRDANHLELVAAGDLSTYRLLRLTSGHPQAVARYEAPEGQARDLAGAIREFRRSSAELIRFARTSVREGKPTREAAGAAAQRAAAVLAARERQVNAGLHYLGIPPLRMLSGTARSKTEVLARFAHGCRTAGLSVGTVARVVAEVGPVVLGSALAGAAATLASRFVMRQVFGLGRDVAKEFLYGERERGR
jgi:Relaxase/Mobilisation nuclease domain